MIDQELLDQALGRLNKALSAGLQDYAPDFVRDVETVIRAAEHASNLLAAAKCGLATMRGMGATVGARVGLVEDAVRRATSPR